MFSPFWADLLYGLLRPFAAFGVIQCFKKSATLANALETLRNSATQDHKSEISSGKHPVGFVLPI